VFNLVPDWLGQSVLPGWFSITVNNRNSRSPRTEEDIVREHSYGRQLGTLSEAVAALIRERSPDPAQVKEEFKPLLELHDQIRTIKERSKAERLNRLQAELALLEKEWPEEYARIARKLARDAGA
jgi:hypothetical protein